MKIKRVKIAAEKTIFVLVCPDGTEARCSNGGLIVFRTQKEAEDWVQYMLCEVGK